MWKSGFQSGAPLSLSISLSRSLSLSLSLLLSLSLSLSLTAHTDQELPSAGRTDNTSCTDRQVSFACILGLFWTCKISVDNTFYTRSSKAPGAYLSRPVYQHSAPLPSTLQARVSVWRETGTQPPVEEKERQSRESERPPTRECVRARIAQERRAAPAHDPSRCLHVHARSLRPLLRVRGLLLCSWTPRRTAL